MNAHDKHQVDQALMRHGDDFWNKTDPDEIDSLPNRAWVIEEIETALKHDGLAIRIVNLRKE